MPSVKLAASIAVLNFNEGKEMGMKHLYEVLGIELIEHAREFYKLGDKMHLYWSIRRADEEEKGRRKHKSRARAQAEEEAEDAEGGPQCLPGGF